jgi:hypothetical protein
LKRHETLVEKKIREAMEKGEFDDLPGKGEPIDLAENPFEDPALRMVHRLLKNAGFAPAWIEARKEIETELEQARTTLVRARRLYGDGPEWERVVREFRGKTGELNERIRIYNLKAPGAAFQRSHISIEAEIERAMNQS